MKIFMFAASLNSNSVNKKLLNAAKNLLGASHEVSIKSLNEFDVPLYSPDLQIASGLPTNVINFIHDMSSSDGIVFAVPEYNYSIPGAFKNLIDWVSRYQPNPWRQKKILLISASPSVVGGNRGLWATRIPLEGCGAYVFPDMFSLSESYKNIDAEGHMQDQANSTKLQTLLNDFCVFCK